MSNETVETPEEKAKRLEAELTALKASNPEPIPDQPPKLDKKRAEALFEKLLGDSAKEGEGEEDSSKPGYSKSRKQYNGLSPEQRKKKANKELGRGLEDLKEELEKKYGIVYIPWPNIINAKLGHFTVGFDAKTKEEYEQMQ